MRVPAASTVSHGHVQSFGDGTWPRGRCSGLERTPPVAKRRDVAARAGATVLEVELRRDELQLEAAALAQQVDPHGAADAVADHHPLHVVDRLDRVAVDGDDEVLRTEAGGGS